MKFHHSHSFFSRYAQVLDLGHLQGSRHAADLSLDPGQGAAENGLPWFAMVYLIWNVTRHFELGMMELPNMLWWYNIDIMGYITNGYYL